MRDRIPHRELLSRVARQLSFLQPYTDRQVLARWRIVGLCQYLLGNPSNGIEAQVLSALEKFADDGLSEDVTSEIQSIRSTLARKDSARFKSVLPTIGDTKREQVLSRLEGFKFAARDKAIQILERMSEIKKRLEGIPPGVLISGLRHRLDLLAEILENETKPERCQIASAAILYVHEMNDATPDDLGQIGLLDDDFALRIALEILDNENVSSDTYLHWSEKISSIWDDMPFLQGIDLIRNNQPVPTNWLDRLFSYALYSRVLSSQNVLTICTQPSIACSLLHSIISLIGFTVLDTLTSTLDPMNALKIGHLYTIDNSVYVRFRGITSGDQTGWMKLEVGRGSNNLVISIPPTLAARMVTVPEHNLSSYRQLTEKIDTSGDEPIQRFFAWQEAIGAGLVPSRIVLVTSRERAQFVFGGVTSHDVHLLDSGLMTFIGLHPDQDELKRGLVLIVPNLGVVRHIAERGISICAIVIDGYDRLARGWHQLDFIRMAIGAVPIILWTTVGYSPERTPSWMPKTKELSVSQAGLAEILKLNTGDIGEDSEIILRSLRQAATGPQLECERVRSNPEEEELASAIEHFRRAVNQTDDLPDYWVYYLHSSSSALRALVSCTPAYWDDIREVANEWHTSFTEQWACLRSQAAKRFEIIPQSLNEVFSALNRVSVVRNVKAETINQLATLGRLHRTLLVSLRPEQQKVAITFQRRANLPDIEPILLRDLDVVENCVVCGWSNRLFAHRLWAHTPISLLAVVDATEENKWQRARTRHTLGVGDTLLETVGCEMVHVPVSYEAGDLLSEEWKRIIPSKNDSQNMQETLRDCVFVWLSGESDGKVLPRNSRVIVEQGGVTREKPACDLLPEDRAILGPGAARWSPAEEFTQALVIAVERSQPDLVKKSKEWRRLLSQIKSEKGWSTDELRDELVLLGVSRLSQTIDGWLRLDRAHPIGPQHLSEELRAIWTLVGSSSEYSIGEVSDSCIRLRSLRRRAGLALLQVWMGKSSSIGVDDEVISTLVDQLRKEVQVYEVESISFGSVPTLMLWWWVPLDLAERYESDFSDSNEYDIGEEEDLSSGEDVF